MHSLISRLQEQYKTGELPNQLETLKTPREFLPPGTRQPIPFTASRYTIKEDDRVISWERAVREFLHSLKHCKDGHVISDKDIYVWVTGKTIEEALTEKLPVRADLKKIRKILTFYLGASYKTTRLGVKLNYAWRVRPTFNITKRTPMTLRLKAERSEGILAT